MRWVHFNGVRVTCFIIDSSRISMWIMNWFKSTLESLGLVNKKAKIVFLGLDDAGKTTLLLRLKEDVMKQMDPTQQPYS
jgi:GTP-binding protein SAR1